MCDDSLGSTQTRLAEEGEELVLHQFATGRLGFASVSDFTRLERQARNKPDGFWAVLKAWLSSRWRSRRLSAICIPPGTCLLLDHVPLSIQTAFGIASSELVMFTEISSPSGSYRDALLFPNGTRVLLQNLPPGIQATVLHDMFRADGETREVKIFTR